MSVLQSSEPEGRSGFTIAVISDIHGNAAALDAVLEDIAQRDVDLIVNLGDICSGPLFPEETADRLMRLNFPTVRGNHERQLLERSLAEMGPSDRFAKKRLRIDQLDWIRALPTALSPIPGVLMLHGSPGSDVSYLLESVSESGLRPATPTEVLERLGHTSVGLVLCGHTHIQRCMHLQDETTVVNPGSVGLPAYEDDRPHPHIVEAGTPHARYALVRRDYVSRWTATFLAVEYDWLKAADVALCRGRPDWAVALRTGRAR